MKILEKRIYIPEKFNLVNVGNTVFSYDLSSFHLHTKPKYAIFELSLLIALANLQRSQKELQKVEAKREII